MNAFTRTHVRTRQGDRKSYTTKQMIAHLLPNEEFSR